MVGFEINISLINIAKFRQLKRYLLKIITKEKEEKLLYNDTKDE